MEKIILDTNFLLSVFELNIDIFAEIDRVCDFKYELYVLDRTVDEVENLINGSLLSKKRTAQAALKLIKVKKIQILATKDPRPVDDILADLSGCIIATADMELKRRLRKNRQKILTIRQKRYVILE